MEEKVYGEIYLISNTVNSKLYVGQTTDSTEKRFKAHLKTAETKDRNYRYIHAAISCHKAENFKAVAIFVAFDKITLDKAEEDFIKEYKSLSTENGYNLESKPRGTGKRSESSKQKNKNWAEINIYRPIVGMNVKTGETKEYIGIFETKQDGFTPANVGKICRKEIGRNQCKGWTWRYKEDEKWPLLPFEANALGCYRNKFKDNKIVVGRNIKTGETKEWDNIREVVKDGFNYRMTYAILHKQPERWTHKDWQFKYKNENWGIIPDPRLQKTIKAVIRRNPETGELREYVSIAATKQDGFDNFKVSLVCSKKEGRTRHKGFEWFFKDKYDK